MYPIHPEREGQIALIAILVMVVMMTLGLSLYSRSTLDVSLSRQQDQSARTFQAAESGVEEALSQDFATIPTAGKTGSVSVSTDLSVNYKIVPQSTISTRVEEGEGLQIDVTGVAANQGVQLTWGKGASCPASGSAPSDTTPPPLLIRVYNKGGTSGAYSARNYGISPCTYGANDFPIANSTNVPGFSAISGSATLGYSTILTLQAFDVRVSIQPMNASTEIAVAGSGWTLPAQYHKITATAATNTTGAAKETKAVEVTRTIPQWPYFMDYVLYSGTTIVK